MTRDDGSRLELSRRRLLAGLGVAGLASAGAGLGTSAYFSDREEFTGNRLAAGKLNMVVSYEEHYSDWSPDETTDIPDDAVTMDDPGVDAGATGIVGDDVGPVWVDDQYVDQFMDNTLYNTDAGEPAVLDDADPCGSADTANDDPAAHVDLSDVKPGDFGEVTMDFALCDNPGYVWLSGGLDAANENGLTEPEAEDPDEQSGVVELLDEVQTRVWYDADCDNVYDQTDDPACVDLIVDTSGSMEDPVYANGDPTITKAQAANEIARDIVTATDDADGTDDGVLGSNPLGHPDNYRFAVNSFADTDQVQTPLTDDEQAVLDGLDQALANTPAGGTNVAEALELAEASLRDCQHDRRFAVLFTNNPSPDSSTRQDIRDAATNLKDVQGVVLKIVALGVEHDSPEADFWQDVASTPTDVFVVYQDGGIGSPGGDGHVRSEMAAAASSVTSQVAGGTGPGGERLLFQGTLREMLGAVGPHPGLPLDPGGTAGRGCYDANVRSCLAFAWWLPVDHANEIQTDSVTFDLGFYTEQCRHNDGSGMVPETTATEAPGGG